MLLIPFRSNTVVVVGLLDMEVERVKKIEIQMQAREYVTKIAGTYMIKIPPIPGTIRHEIVITSLTFITNCGKAYCPYGPGGGVPFESSDHGKVVGFFGRSGEHLNQIGIYKEGHGPFPPK
uniref:TSA: Wollemia nobilis Ref_Wollemi_Transcript_13861_935 transcribed RNA sequence n=1 Tax=Wollemia nobilis TaxID=56998 RepID=A0A0C9RKA5_9CONI